MQRGNSDVKCQQVQDSVECAQRIRNGSAEFGVVSAESALLLATLRWDGLTVLKELRHRDRIDGKIKKIQIELMAFSVHEENIDMQFAFVQLMPIFNRRLLFVPIIRMVSTAYAAKAIVIQDFITIAVNAGRNVF